MNPMEIVSRVGPDGVLKCNIAMGPSQANRTVKLTVESVDGGPEERPVADADWRRFVQQTAGSIPDPTFVRHEQGELQERGEIFP